MSHLFLQQMAEQYQYIVVAPDSNSALLSGWEIPTAKQAPTPDILHTQVSLYIYRQPILTRPIRTHTPPPPPSATSLPLLIFVHLDI